MTNFWSVLLGLLIIAVLVLLVAITHYVINSVFDELMKH